MAESRIHQVDKKTWNKWSFYINIIAFFIVALSIYLLIIDAYNAGTVRGSQEISSAWFHIVRDVAFLAISLTWIFFQLFKNQLLIMRRPW
jgi:hypothetical protein